MASILWHSTNPTIPTGYGNTTKLLVPKLANYHKMTISCHAGLFGAVQMWKGIKMLPHTNFPGQYGMDIIEHHAKHVHPDMIISWVDAFILQADKIKPLPWCAWVPVDSMPLMSRNIEPLKACKWIVAPTEWGKQAIEAVGLKVDAVIPCTYDPSIYFYIEKSMKEKRETLSSIINMEIGDKFLVNVVSANSSYRKNFSAILEAWKLFQKTCPDSLLFLHTDPTGYFFQGENLNDMGKVIGVDPNSIIFPPQWEFVCGAIGDDFLNLLYNCSDVHVNACYGEGFGIPIIEAQASGCPVLTPDFGAAKEINTCNTLIEGKMVYKVPGAMQFEIDPISLKDQLVYLYEHSTLNLEYQALDRKQISERMFNYKTQIVSGLWVNWINKALSTNSKS